MDYSELKPVFDTVEKAMGTLGIDYYLIGALARDIWYQRSQIHSRATRDVDFAILVGSEREYEAVKTYLIENEGYVQLRGNAYVLISPEKHQVDLLPFGEIASSGSVLIEGQGMTKISVAGMQEVYERGTEKIEFQTGNTFKAATIASIALLKLIAYDDRPEARQKDAKDIGNILLHYFEMHTDIIYEEHLDLFPDQDELGSAEQWESTDIGTIVLGREMARIAQGSQALHERLIRILSDEIASGEKSQFIRLIAKDRGMEIQEVITSLTQVRWGLENAAPQSHQ
jgi:predicted nucleotidyltransferase